MNKRSWVLLGVLVILAVVLAACGGVPKDAKESINDRIPGSQVRSAQKAKLPPDDTADKGWCVVTEKGGTTTNWIVLKGTVGESGFTSVFQDAPEEMFTGYGCTNWSG